MSRRYKFKAVCLVCGHSGMVHHESKEGYKEVSVCPKCNGAFVDAWNKHKYINNSETSNDEGSNDEVRIEITSVNSAPVVHVNGEILKGIINIHYLYSTKTDSFYGENECLIEYIDQRSESIKTIGSKRFSVQ